MTSLRNSLRPLRCLQAGKTSQWVASSLPRPALAIRRKLSTETTTPPSDPSPSAAAPEEPSLSRDPILSVKYARIAPASPSYFARDATFYDALVRVSDVAARYENLPILPKDKAPRIRWKNLMDYRREKGELVQSTMFTTALNMCKRLMQIHPDLMPEEVKEIISDFHHPYTGVEKQSKVTPLDEHGRAMGKGSRKASTVRAFVVEGTGEVMVNGKNLAESFQRIHDRESAIWPLAITQRMDKYNVWAIAKGGGTTGQSEAMALAVAKSSADPRAGPEALFASR